VDGWKDQQAPSTIGRQYSCLRALMAWAEASEYIVRTPCRDIRLPRSRLVDRPALDAKQLAIVAESLGPDQAPRCGWEQSSVSGGRSAPA
jgi:hypothetical protein